MPPNREHRGDPWVRWWAGLALWTLAACPSSTPRVVDDVHTGRAVLFTEEKTAEDLQLSPSGRTLLLVSGPRGHDDRGATRVFATDPLRLLWQAESYGAALSPSEEHVAIAVSDPWRIEVRERRSGKRIASFPVSSWPFSWVGPSQLALVRRQALDIVDLGSKRVVTSIPTDQTVLECKASADGSLLALRQEHGPPIAGSLREQEVRLLRLPAGTVHCVTPAEGPLVLATDGRFVGSRHGHDVWFLSSDACHLVMRASGCSLGSFPAGERWITSAPGAEAKRPLALSFDMETSAAASMSLPGAPEQISANRTTLAEIHSVVQPSAGSYLQLWPAAQLWSAQDGRARVAGKAFHRVACPPLEPPRPASLPERALQGRITLGDGYAAFSVSALDAGVLLDIENHSAKTMRIDWKETWLADERGGTITTGHLGRQDCVPFTAPRADTTLPAGARASDEVRVARPCASTSGSSAGGQPVASPHFLVLSLVQADQATQARIPVPAAAP